MKNLIHGLHHVTALAGHPQKNLDFYSGTLGMRLVKKTINFDATHVYHLYYGDKEGNPGTIMTFFPFPGIPNGKKGYGQSTVTSFSISENSIDFWYERLKELGLNPKHPQERYDEAFISFEDHDGLGLELVSTKVDDRLGFAHDSIPQEHAIKGFHGVTITASVSEKTAALLIEKLNHQKIAEASQRFRLSTHSHAKPGGIIDIEQAHQPVMGREGAGTIHHVAFGTSSEESQLEIREILLEAGYQVTPVLDRQYFKSIYFREPGGVLFEVATDPPGFLVDESIENLGESLKLPPWEEGNRKQIEKNLIPIELKK